MLSLMRLRIFIRVMSCEEVTSVFINILLILSMRGSMSGSNLRVIQGKTYTYSCFADILRFGIVESLQWNQFLLLGRVDPG